MSYLFEEEKSWNGSLTGRLTGITQKKNVYLLGKKCITFGIRAQAAGTNGTCRRHLAANFRLTSFDPTSELYFRKQATIGDKSVSKKWRALVLNPLVWQTVEVSFAKKTVTHDNDHFDAENSQNKPFLDSAMRSDNFIQFFQKICTAVVDLNLEVDLSSSNTGVSSILDSIFQLRTLERFRFALINNQKKAHKKAARLGDLNSRALLNGYEYCASLVPACKNLKLLNFESADGLLILPVAYKILFSASPNLEEFYPPGMPNPTFDPTVFTNNTPKLKRFSLCTYSKNIKKYIDACPSLEYLILREPQNLSRTERNSLDKVGLHSMIRKYKNTYIVFSTIFEDIESLSIDELNILKPLFTRYNRSGQSFLSNIVTQWESSLREILNFFVNEMHYDINGRDIPDYCYRPSFSYLKSESLPILATHHEEKLKELFDFGAQVEIPEMSLLTRCYTVKPALLLLKYGADPHRTAKGETLPAYVTLLHNLTESCKHKSASQIDSVTDLHLVIRELGKRGCDLSFCGRRPEYGSSLLDDQIRTKNTLAIEAMLEYGAKWEWTEEAVSFAKNDIEKIEDLLKKGKIDIASMPIEAGLYLCEKKYTLSKLLTDCFKANRDYRDAHGLSLMHYFTLIPSPDHPKREMPPPGWKMLTMFSRWRVESPSSKSLVTHASSNPFDVSFASTPSRLFKAENTAPNPPSIIPSFLFASDTSNVKLQTLNSTETSSQSDALPLFTSVSSVNKTIFSFSTAQPANETSSSPSTGSESHSSVFSFSPTSPFGNPFSSQTPMFSFSSPSQVDNRTNTNLFSFTDSEQKYDWARDFKDIFVKQIGIDLNAKNDKGDTPLHTLMRANADPFMKLQRALVMIESGADPLAKNNIGESVLSTACLHGVWEVVFALLEKYNANLNEQDKDGLTPLMNAIYGYKHNDIDEQHEFKFNFARVLTKYQVDFSLNDEHGRSLIHLLASLGDKELLIPYLDEMDVNARDESGFTPLHYAIMFGNDQLIEPLIKCGADVNAQTTSLKLTPLMLLQHIVNPSSPYYCYLYHYATAFFGSLTGKSNYYVAKPPPYKATLSRARSFVTAVRNVPESIQLFRAMSDLSLIDRFGNSVEQANDLKPTFIDDTDHPFIQFVKKLFQNTHALVFNALGEEVGWLDELTRTLEKNPASINVRDSDGNTPLHIACQFFHMGVADSIFACLEDEHQSAPYCLVAFMLLKYGADPTVKNNKGETPLDYVPNLKELAENKYDQVFKATTEITTRHAAAKTF